jgi:capsular exopolysaccharide synthesis family protein
VLRILSVFRRRWWVPVLCCSVLSALLIVSSLLKPPRFMATGMVQLSMDSQFTGDGRRRDTSMVRGAMFETHRRLLTSHSVVEDAIRRMGVELAMGSARREQRERFLWGLEIIPVKGTFLVEVNAQGTDPAVLVRKVNALMDAFIPFTSEFLGSRFVVRERHLKDKEENILKLLREAEQRQRDFYDRSGSPQFEDQRRSLLSGQQAIQQRLTSLRIERALAEAERERLQTLHDRIQTESEDIENLAARVAGTPETEATAFAERRAVISQIKTRLRQLEATLDAARLAELPDYAEQKQRLQIERRALASEARDFVRAALAGMEERGTAMIRSEEKLNEQLEEFTSELSRLDRLEGQFRTIKREVEWFDRELEETRAELRQIQSVIKSDAGGAVIVNRAEAPDKPEPRLTAAKVFFVALLAFGLGTFLIVTWDHLDDTLTREDEVALLGLPVLGAVPHLDFREVDELSHVRGSFWTAESFGLIRTNISVNAGGSNKSAILITSGSPRDGKSFVSLNLAASYARTGGKTLIIEADMRRPRIQGILNVRHSEGLSDLLADERPLSELVKTTEFPNLTLLPAGPCPLNPADLLLRGQFERVIQSAIKDYDHVVIDAPPACPLADTSLMSPYAQGVIYVARMRKSRRRLVTAAIEQVQAVGGKNLGLILNDVTIREEPALEYVGYGYYGPPEESEDSSSERPALFVVAPAHEQDDETPLERRGKLGALLVFAIALILGTFVVLGQTELLPTALQEAFDGLSAAAGVAPGGAPTGPPGGS